MPNEFKIKNGFFSEGNSNITGSLNVSGGITGSLLGTASFSTTAISSSYPIAISGTTIYSKVGITPLNFNTTFSIFLGSNAGYNAPNANNSNFLGTTAGVGATSANNSNFLGTIAGVGATNANSSNFIGISAGGYATNAISSNFIGTYPGYSATSASHSNFLGTSAGYVATNANYSNFLGYTAGNNATNANYSNFLGYVAGGYAASASYSTFLGFQAGYSLPSFSVNLSTSINIGDITSFDFGYGSIYGVTSANTTTIVVSGDQSYYPYPYSSSYFVLEDSFKTIYLDPFYYQPPIVTNITYNLGLDETTFTFSPPLESTYYEVTSSFPGMGRNNIVIGTNVGLPNNAQNAINIGGIIFGSGSYFNSSSLIDNYTLNSLNYTGSANGKIGINQPNPQASLDVYGSVLITGSLNVSGGITGSLLGTASFAQTASYVNPLNQIVEITGSLQVQNSLNSSTRFLINSLGTSSLNWEDGYLYNGLNLISLDWKDKKLYDSNEVNSIFWDARQLYKSDGTTITLDWETGAFTGSMLGTASYATQALSSSYAVQAGNTSTIDINVFGSPVDSYLLFSNVAGTTGVAIGGDADLRYNASTNTLTAVNISATNLTGSLFGTASYAVQALSSSYALNATSASYATQALSSSYPIAASGSLLYSVLPSSISTGKNNAILLGASAGGGTTTIYNSNFIGYGAGGSATNAYQSNFIGVYAGNEAIAADNSNFIGLFAGYKAVSASFSTLIGWQAGYTSDPLTSIGTNNIIIGTNITLPSKSRNSINLGGIIFATGSYSSIAGNPYSGSQYNIGKIGINKVTPDYTLDVSGSGNYTNGLLVTGSLIATSFTGSLLGTASYATQALSSSYAVTASHALTASYLNPLNQDLTLNGNLTVNGTASYTYVTASQLDVGTNFISVNVGEPVERFGGLKVYDSGSFSHLATASLAWDSLHNHWVYQNASGSTYSGGMLLAGPRNTGSLGDEPNLTRWFVIRSDGGDHTNDTQIFSSGSIHIVTGSLTVTEGITGSLLGTASYASQALSSSYSVTSSYVQNAQSASYVLQAVSASFASTASSVNTLNQNVLISGSLTVGATTEGASENTLILGPKGTQEGGQMLFQAGTSYTSASMLDMYQDSTNPYFRLLRGSNAGSDAVVAQWNMHTKQMFLPAYNSPTAFTATPLVGLLGFDSNGALITTTTSSGGGGGGVTITNNVDNYVITATGTANTLNGESNMQFNGSSLTITGEITSSGAIRSLANGAMYFRGGDDAEFWDINVANTVGIYGQQDATVASIKLGSGGGTLSGKSSNIGVGTINPQYGLDVNGSGNYTNGLLVTGSLTLSGSQVITGSLRGQVSTLTIASTTASIDMSSNNFFILNLVNGANTHINPTNLQPGQTVNIRVNQGSLGTGTVSFPSFVDQPSGSAYTGTQISNAIDIVTMITFDSSLVFVSSVRNMI